MKKNATLEVKYYKPNLFLDLLGTYVFHTSFPIS